MLDIDINVKVLTENLHNFVNLFMLFSYKQIKQFKFTDQSLNFKRISAEYVYAAQSRAQIDSTY